MWKCYIWGTSMKELDYMRYDTVSLLVFQIDFLKTIHLYDFYHKDWGDFS